MRIATPTEIESAAWEGALEPMVETYSEITPSLRVTLGEPAWWSAEQIMENVGGKKWVSPSGHRRYVLLRMACALHRPTDARTGYVEATFTMYLRPRQGAQPVVAYDLYPQDLAAETRGKFTVGLGEALKFSAPTGSGPEDVGVEIEYHQVFPVIRGYGLGESSPYWQFARDDRERLLGCQNFYVVLDVPREAGGVQLNVELIATLETRWGAITVGLPEEAYPHTSRMIS